MSDNLSNPDKFGQAAGLKTGDVLNTPVPATYKDILAHPLPTHSALYFQDQQAKQMWEATDGQNIDIYKAQKLLFANLPGVPIGVFRSYENKLALMVTCIHDPNFDEQSYLQTAENASSDIITHHDSGLSFTAGQSPYNTDFHYTVFFQQDTGSAYLLGMDTRPSLQRRGIATSAQKSLFNYYDATGWTLSHLLAESPISTKTWIKQGFMPLASELAVQQHWARAVLSEYKGRLDEVQEKILKNFSRTPSRKNLHALIADEILAEGLVDHFIFDDKHDRKYFLIFDLKNKEHRAHLARYQPESKNQQEGKPDSGPS